MIKRTLFICSICIFTFSLTGCATIRRKDLQQQGLRNRIKALEIQLREKGQELTGLKGALAVEMQKKDKLKQEISKVKYARWLSVRPSAEQIQKALKNAGYDPGPIDGKMGGKTRKAIRAFQKANGLEVDGKIGKLTWDVLEDYLEVKTE